MKSLIQYIFTIVICYLTFYIIAMCVCFHLDYDPGIGIYGNGLVLNLGPALFLTDYLIKT
jgi:hypothetical protein